jgi:prevent-host-death family protein
MKTQLKKSVKSGRLKKGVHVKVARQVQTSYTATEAKNEFGRLLEKAIHGTTVVITKHQSPRAVLISMDKFEALAKAPEVKLDTLSEQFDALLARMQAPGVRGQMSAAFKASPKKLGEAAVAAARKRG